MRSMNTCVACVRMLASQNIGLHCTAKTPTDTTVVSFAKKVGVKVFEMLVCVSELKVAGQNLAQKPFWDSLCHRHHRYYISDQSHYSII